MSETHTEEPAELSVAEDPSAVVEQSPAPASSEHVTRVGGTFLALLGGSAVLILLLVFILENTRSVSISFIGATGHMPLGVALLLSAAAGALLVGLAGAARVFQLRHRLRARV